MKTFTKRCIPASLAVALGTLAGAAVAHDPGSLGPGTPVCIESNIMLADAENAPFSNDPGLGRVLEMNITTGERGITVESPFSDPLITPLCPDHVSCPGPFKPTGIVSGGEDGHAYLVSAAQHALVEHHRNGTAIKTSPVWPTSPSPTGGGFGFVPRLLGNGFMPNGNIAQTVCDANFFNAPNSDRDGNGDLVANSYFPPVNGTDTRGANGRIVIVDQDTLEVIDEYSMPTKGDYANDPRWNCPAGVIFTSEGLFVSMFHGDAVFVIDWRAGVDKESRGVGANKPKGCGSSSDDDGDGCAFKLGKKKNQAVITRVIDLSNDGTNSGIVNYDDSATNYDSGHRRDNLRAIRMSEDGTLYGTRRSRSDECNAGDPDCNPGVFRQHVFVAAPGSNIRTGTLALDPGVNILAGVTINRMSALGCKYVTGGLDPTTVSGDVCDVETLYIGVSAGNAGCGPIGSPAVSPNPCFEPRGAKGGGGTLYEYRIDAASLDGVSGPCDGNPLTPATNTGCALPIAQFEFVAEPGTGSLPPGTIETLDPRMVMAIHEAFVQ